MEIFVYKNGSDHVKEGFSFDELPALIADKTNVVWVDMLAENSAAIAEARRVLVDIFRFHPLTVEDIIETRNQPKIEAFPNYLFFTVHGVRPGETSSSNFVTKELDGYLGDNFVVTFHLERFRSIKTVKQQVRSSPFACQRGAAYLLHQVLDQLVDLYMPMVDDYDRAINDLEERVFAMKKDSGRSILEEIMDLRRSVARLRRISARQLDVLYRISHGEFPQIPANILPFYRDVHDHLLRISDLAENYRDLISGLFDMHFAVVATKTNEVMKTLAVVSAIILPLSLIAGIYGMNFDNIPETKSAYGYFLTLGAMAAITIVLLIYFWKRGWIFQKDAVELEPARRENDPEDQ